MTLRNKFMRELATLGLPQGPAPGLDLAPVSDADLEPLPEAARRYLGYMRVLGRPRDWAFRLGFWGRFRRSRREPWMQTEAWTYDTRPKVARLFHMQLRFFGVLPVVGRDTYVDGHGRMLIRVLDGLTVGDGRGEAFDVGELSTYLNDGVLIAPSMLLSPDVTWSEVDAHSFDVSLTDHGRTAKARVFIDERGAPLDFETSDRFYADPKNANKTTRCRWTTPVEGWQEVGDRKLPTRGKAIWHPSGEEDLVYAELDFLPDTLAFNVAPGQ